MKLYKLKTLLPMRPYLPNEDITKMSVASEDILEEGGMVAHDPANPADQWYVAKEFFKENYELVPDMGGATPTIGMDFGEAMDALQAGLRLQRLGWNGEGMYIIYVPGSVVKLAPGTPYHDAITECGRLKLRAGLMHEILPHIDMWTITAEGRRAFLPGWTASQSDMLAKDWQAV